MKCGLCDENLDEKLKLMQSYEMWEPIQIVCMDTGAKTDSSDGMESFIYFFPVCRLIVSSLKSLPDAGSLL